MPADTTCPACGERPVDAAASHWTMLLPLLLWLGPSILQPRCADCAGARHLLALASWAFIVVAGFVLAVIMLSD